MNIDSIPALLGQTIVGGSAKRKTSKTTSKRNGKKKGGEISCKCSKNENNQEDEVIFDDIPEAVPLNQENNAVSSVAQDQSENLVPQNESQLSDNLVQPNQEKYIIVNNENKYDENKYTNLDNSFYFKSNDVNDNNLYTKSSQGEFIQLNPNHPDNKEIYEKYKNVGMAGGYSRKRYRDYLEKMDVQRLYKLAKNKNISVTVKRDGKTKYIKKDTVVKKLMEFHFSQSKPVAKPSKKEKVEKPEKKSNKKK